MRSQRLLGYAVSLFLVIGLTGGVVSTGVAADNCPFQVRPFVFDPDQTGTVVSQWVPHLGEPGNCGDTSRDRFGLLLSKNTLTTTNAAAGAEITGVEGIHLMEVGWDIRKKTPPGTPDGSHCGAGAPRFNVTTSDGLDPLHRLRLAGAHHRAAGHARVGVGAVALHPRHGLSADHAS